MNLAQTCTAAPSESLPPLQNTPHAGDGRDRDLVRVGSRVLAWGRREVVPLDQKRRHHTRLKEGKVLSQAVAGTVDEGQKRPLVHALSKTRLGGGRFRDSEPVWAKCVHVVARPVLRGLVDGVHVDHDHCALGDGA
eukprot:CAMPEP_0196748542 /NCGR_PEP_ID=MMETSP1091-20130531/73748_1 /TAXON_ID=302021 /ORGANISM="Rhodomonas sp., Strain CCMP768" /LENGTH=135 /DNA_ID=CAMNT_0042095873 /DNA_START=102 /DNA_END=507 /DNA_ORIENTATION=+